MTGIRTPRPTTTPRTPPPRRAVTAGTGAAAECASSGRKLGARVRPRDNRHTAVLRGALRLGASNPEVHDLEFWTYVWDQVEVDARLELAGRPGAGAPAQQTRRRLVGKQPPVLVIEVRRRIVGKTPPPRPRQQEEPPRAAQAPQAACGHYDVLGLRRTASNGEVHAAYRRRALATHPDKGGDPRDFHRVVAAFEELADAARRAAYDRSLELFGRRDGTAAEEPPANAAYVDALGKQSVRGEQIFFASARVAQVRLLATPPFAWQWFLAKMQSKALEFLSRLLRGVKVKAPVDDEIFDAGPTGRLSSWQGPTCISRLKSGYKVVVTWETLSVSTGFTRSLTQAVDWQIALLWLRGLAQERMRSHARSGVALTEDELLQVLECEPTMELAFTITVQLRGEGKRKGKKVSAPSVPDLQTAMDFRRRFLDGAGMGDAEASLQREKRRAEEEAAQLRCKRRACERQLLAAAGRELQVRSAGQAKALSPKGRPAGAASSVPEVVAPTPRRMGTPRRPGTPRQRWRCGEVSPAALDVAPFLGGSRAPGRKPATPGRCCFGTGALPGTAVESTCIRSPGMLRTLEQAALGGA